MIELQCQISNVIYSNCDNGYAVVTAKNLENGKYISVVFDKCMLNPKTGYSVNAHGEWVENPRFGRQFVVSQYEDLVPDTTDSIIMYLSCGIFKGIGEKIAHKIVDKFGEDTINIIENNPDRLYEVNGLGKKKIQSIILEWESHKQIQDIVTFFSQYGLTMNMVMKIYKEYGRDAISIVSENPYRLASDIDTIGFKRADDIALKLGVDKNDPNRIASCLKYILTEEGENGHTFLYHNTLVNEANEYLTISKNNIEEVIANMLAEDELKTTTENCEDIFVPQLYYAEKNVAFKLSQLNKSKPYVSNVRPITVEDIEKIVGVEYNDLQKQAIEYSKTRNLMVLTGGPGTGKTTALMGIIELMKHLNLTFACAAPTGRAAKRMSEVTGEVAKTIHRLLEYNPQMGYQRDETNPLFEDVIIIDEFSMVNVILMDKLLKAIKPNAKLILVGDENQLPCIGPGNLLHDIIVSEKVPVVMLTEIFRQAAGSKIITNAHNIINDKPIIINNSAPDTDFFFIEEKNGDDIETLIDDLVSRRLPQKYKVEPTEIQVLSPRRRDVMCCADRLNTMLQKTLNNHTECVQQGNRQFKMGDKVMQIKNNYDKGVFNGDIGFVTAIDTEEQSVTVTFDDDYTIYYNHYELDELTLAYASTIHKSQGSEYPIIVIPMLRSFTIMLKRNLIYTGITRAKKICVIVGEISALSKAINDDSYDKRNTMLTDWLIEYMN